MIGCADVDFADRVTVINQTEFPASVAVAGVERDEWLGLGRAQQKGSQAFTEVIDQGEVWVFRFGYIDRHQVEMEMSREELANAGWRVQVPASFADELRRMGFEPPP